MLCCFQSCNSQVLLTKSKRCLQVSVTEWRQLFYRLLCSAEHFLSMENTSAHLSWMKHFFSQTLQADVKLNVSNRSVWHETLWREISTSKTICSFSEMMWLGNFLMRVSYMFSFLKINIYDVFLNGFFNIHETKLAVPGLSYLLKSVKRRTLEDQRSTCKTFSTLCDMQPATYYGFTICARKEIA